MIDPLRIRQAIETLQARQDALGDEVVETGLAALQQALYAPAEPAVVPVPSLAGERKRVTVMFADISGFTALSETLDPEEVRSIINACFEQLGAVIARYDGYIDKFIGDEIMALFGAPAAHENDPERALRAALDMMAALADFNAAYSGYLPRPLNLHFGINTGLVITGGIGTRQRQDYSVIGDTVNLASRLEGLGEAGDILVGEETYRRTAPLFEFEPLKPVKLKGKSRPVRVYRLVGAKSAAGQVRGIEGLSSPLVGRRPEMALLKEALANLGRGRGGVISITGEAGLGKSRLVTELYLECHSRLQETHTRWATGRALSYGESVSYLVARDLFYNLLQRAPEDSLAQVGVLLQAELDELFTEPSGDIYPYLARLLEVPLDSRSARRLSYLEGEALHRQIFEAARRYLLAKANRRPVILVWDDLHWADPSSLGLLEALLPLTQQCPLLLLLVYRPRREGRIWDFHRRIEQTVANWSRVELAPLTVEQCEQLLNNLLGSPCLPPATRQLILEKAEGNPFYVEEVIRALIDRGAIVQANNGQTWQVAAGIETIPIPDTLQGVIMARIDRLPRPVKRLLQVAAVVGRRFAYRVVARVMDAAGTGPDSLKTYLQNLETANLITLEKKEPEPEYAFNHIFTQESVYRSLLNTDRRRLHQQVGEALEEIYLSAGNGAPPEDVAPVLAYHFEQSGDKPRALKYLKLAADQARAAYANQEAKILYGHALNLLDRDDFARRWDLLADREQVLDRLGERDSQTNNLIMMQTIAELLKDDARLATTHNRRSVYFDKISEYRAAAEAAEAGRWVARRAGNKALEAQSLNLLALAAWRRFDYPMVKEWANQALDALRVVGNPADRINSLLHLGRASYRLGQYDLALEYIHSAQNVIDYTNNRDSDALSDLILGWIYQRLGNYDRAEQHFRLSLQKRQLIGDRYGEATALSHLGWLARDQKQYNAGLEYCRAAFDISQAIGDLENKAYALSGMGLNYEQLGNLDKAVACYRQALSIQREIGAATLAIFDRAGLARIALLRQNLDEARQHITPVVEWILAGQAQKFWDPWTIYQSAYEVLTALGQTGKARAILDEAHEVLHHRVEQISNKTLRQRFLNNIMVNREIEQTWRTLHGRA